MVEEVVMSLRMFKLSPHGETYLTWFARSKDIPTLIQAGFIEVIGTDNAYEMARQAEETAWRMERRMLDGILGRANEVR